MSSLFTKIDQLETRCKKLQEMLEDSRKTLNLLEEHRIYSNDDLIKHIAIFKRYKTRSGKYDESKKKLELVIEHIGIKKYNKIIANWKQELVKDRMI